ncbi:class I SAM-dependent methyltransferase [Agrobacterium fabrum]|uniref:class I SAM-dependent methyltransferase n=1 Tax=Agrobacterium fabrum TaxID=1176649 RepID=UPI003BA183AB
MSSQMGYIQSAKELAIQYESITFVDVHRDVLDLFPSAPSRVCDIGAGSGRDAAALADLGHSVLAVEPTAELRLEGQRIHAGKAIEWVSDALPLLGRLCARAEHYDLILLTAVWMHLDSAERRSSMALLGSLLATGGRISMSLRHGPVPEGRKMFSVSADETAALASEFGLNLLRKVDREDMLGRADISWSFVVFEKS